MHLGNSPVRIVEPQLPYPQLFSPNRRFGNLNVVPSPVRSPIYQRPGFGYTSPPWNPQRRIIAQPYPRFQPFQQQYPQFQPQQYLPQPYQHYPNMYPQPYAPARQLQQYFLPNNVYCSRILPQQVNLGTSAIQAPIRLNAIGSPAKLSVNRDQVFGYQTLTNSFSIAHQPPVQHHFFSPPRQQFAQPIRQTPIAQYPPPPMFYGYSPSKPQQSTITPVKEKPAKENLDQRFQEALQRTKNIVDKYKQQEKQKIKINQLQRIQKPADSEPEDKPESEQNEDDPNVIHEQNNENSQD